jgi:hypothetical protein
MKMHEREQALGRFIVIKKQIYELGIKAQSYVKEIQEEIDSFFSKNDFTKMDFRKVETLARELQTMQEDFKEKAGKMNELRATFNLTES